MAGKGLNVAGLLAAAGDIHYGEAVTQREHACQAAWLAEDDGADEELVLAALLHDIGHLLLGGARCSVSAPGRLPDHHGRWGAAAVRPFAPGRVVWLIEHHVAAKRYLCTVDHGYLGSLSPASRQSLILQGGLLAPHEQEKLETHPWFVDALRLRRWDDRARDPHAAIPELTGYLPLLERYFGPQDPAPSPRVAAVRAYR